LKLLRSLSLTTVAVLISACGAVKTTDNVFPASVNVCIESASETRFIVHWEDGRYTVENGESSEKFRSEFV
jgi:hypothetical protein